jgi:hypothetical protein
VIIAPGSAAISVPVLTSKAGVPTPGITSGAADHAAGHEVDHVAVVQEAAVQEAADADADAEEDKFKKIK